MLSCWIPFTMNDDKECFFIAPIGETGSEIRERSDKLMTYIVDEAVSEFGYSVLRADQMDQPGSITSQIIQKTVDSDLVIADLTGHNPNVFYELAVRHATGEPYIQLIDSSESIPFDIADLRTIHYGLGVEEAAQAKNEIRSQLESLRDGDPEFDNPISQSAEMQSLRESTDPTDQNLAEVLQTISKLDRKIERIESNMTKSDYRPHVETLESNMMELDQISHVRPHVDTIYDDDGNIRMIAINNERFKVPGTPVTRDFIEHIADKTDMTPMVVRGILENNEITVAG